MINIENLERCINEELRDDEGMSLGKSGWIELITRLRQAEKDAARYRWLRNKCSESNVSEIVLRDNWEMAIDEAMQCNK